MCAEKQQIVMSLWEDLLGIPFDVEELAAGVIDDCGVDAAGLSPADVQMLFFGDLTTRWKNVASAFNEVLNWYLINKCTPEVFIRAVFVSLYLSSAIKSGEGDWEFSFDKMLKLLWRNQELTDHYWRMRILSEILKT